MTFATRLSLFVAIAIAGVVAWQWNSTLDSSREVTRLAIEQFQNGDAHERLQHVSAAQSWWPLAWPVAMLVLACVMFWDDAERWWKRDAA